MKRDWGSHGLLWWEGGVAGFDGKDGMIHEAIRPRGGGGRAREEGIVGTREKKTWEYIGLALSPMTLTVRGKIYIRK